MIALLKYLLGPLAPWLFLTMQLSIIARCRRKWLDVAHLLEVPLGGGYPRALAGENEVPPCMHGGRRRRYRCAACLLQPTIGPTTRYPGSLPRAGGRPAGLWYSNAALPTRRAASPHETRQARGALRTRFAQPFQTFRRARSSGHFDKSGTAAAIRARSIAILASSSSDVTRRNVPSAWAACCNWTTLESPRTSPTR
jgi:hypothetical protein